MTLLTSFSSVSGREEDAAQARDAKVQVLLTRLGLDTFPRHETVLLSVDRISVPGAKLVSPAPRLIKSIQLVGVLQPPSVVLRSGTDSNDPEATFEVIFGRRRVLGARLAGRTMIKCEVYSSAPPQLASLLALIENEQRSLAWIKEIQDLHRLIDEKVGMTLDDLVSFGFDRSSLPQRLKLAQLPHELLASVLSGELTQAAAKKLTRLSDSQLHSLNERIRSGEPLSEELVTQTLRGQINTGLLFVEAEVQASPDSSVQGEPWHSPLPEASVSARPDSLAEFVGTLHALERKLLATPATHNARLLTTALRQELEVLVRASTPALTTTEEVCYG